MKITKYCTVKKEDRTIIVTMKMHQIWRKEHFVQSR